MMNRLATLLILFAAFIPFWGHTPAVANLVITEVMSGSDHPGGTANGDWWELTNSGDSSVALEDFSWDDSTVPVVNTSIFPDVTISAAESIIIINEPDANLQGFKDAWGLGVGVQVVGRDQFTGLDPFSNLSSTNGDRITLFDEDEIEIEMVTFGPVDSLGTSFEWTSNGEDLGLSIAGENGAYMATGDGDGGAGIDVGSPGVSVAEGSSRLIGDMDCDGDVDFDDIIPFVLGIQDAPAYEEKFGIPPTVKGDTDADGDLDFDDITGFVAAISGGGLEGGSPVPEPSSLVLVACGLGLCVITLRRRSV